MSSTNEQYNPAIQLITHTIDPQQPYIAAGSTVAPDDIYRERSQRFKAEFDTQTQLWNRLANLRLLTFIMAVVALGWGFWQSAFPIQLAGYLLTLAFIALVIYHRAVAKRRRRWEELWKINTEAGSRVRRSWGELPLRHIVRASAGEPFAADLDIFGHASLFHLLDTLTTHIGETTLASWLRQPTSPQMVRERQEAIAEMRPMLDLRDELELRGRLINEERPNWEQFLQWAESERWLALPSRAWIPWAALASVAAMWLLAIAQFIGILVYPFWTLFAAANLLFTLTAGREMYGLLERAASSEAGFRSYATAFDLICGVQFRSTLLKSIQAELGKNDVQASAYTRRLYRLTTFVIPASALLYVPIQVATLWNVHLLAAFERWQGTAGKQARVWMNVLGQVEALSALARLSHDNPDWVFPQIDADAQALEAQNLGHPLLPASKRIDNDVVVGPSGTFLLVTGSNMSGKSTLLRSMGMNIVLAGAGGPVCAASLYLPPVDLWTSMRVEDSLERRVSYYMAELQRLKSVVDAARLDRNGERRLFYLLDEILQGTNSAERQIAARRVIMYLVRQGALGAVSTHDLTLPDASEAPDVAAAAQPVHFTETFSTSTNGPSMTFDYKLRPGIATSTNALKLMKMVGLDV